MQPTESKVQDDEPVIVHAKVWMQQASQEHEAELRKLVLSMFVATNKSIQLLLSDVLHCKPIIITLEEQKEEIRQLYARYGNGRVPSTMDSFKKRLGEREQAAFERASCRKSRRVGVL